MPRIREARNASAQTQGAGPSEIHGEPSRLRQVPTSVDNEATQNWKLDTELPDRRVTTLPCRGCDCEAPASFESVLPVSLHPEWSALDSESSVMGSLLTLNAHLVSYERLRRAS